MGCVSMTAAAAVVMIRSSVPVTSSSSHGSFSVFYTHSSSRLVTPPAVAKDVGPHRDLPGVDDRVGRGAGTQERRAGV